MKIKALTGMRRGRRGRSLTLIGLILLLLLGLFYIFGSVSDLVANAAGQIPPDHRVTFSVLTGTSFDHAPAGWEGARQYIGVLERGYALHELTFAVLFILVLLFPFRRRRRWAWWACWILLIANLGYTFTFGVHDPAILSRSLIADTALPVLLLAHIPAFFSRKAG